MRDATPADADAIAAIYAPYVTGTIISLEESAPGAAAMRARIAGAAGAGYPWLVALEGEDVLGYAGSGRFHERPGYRWTALTSVYVAQAAHRRGVGRSLYSALIDRLARQGFAQAIAQISLPNDPSVRLHETMGFAAVGVQTAVGRKFGRWVDVGIWQRALGAPADPPAEPLP